MNLYKSLSTVLRINKCIIITSQITNNCVHSFVVPRVAFLYTNINTFLPFERCHIIKKIHTSQSSSKKCVADEIQHLAESILADNAALNDLDKKEEIIKILNFLLSHGCKLSDIKKKCLNFLTPSNSSYVKILQIAELGSDILELMPFINLSLPSLRKAALQAKEDRHEISGFPNRILYLSHHLGTPVEKLIPALTKHSTLLTMPFSRLDHKMKVLKSAEISAEDLLKDLWIFHYNEKLLTNRISAAEKSGVKLKPWMLRCSDKFFVSRLNKVTETQRILKGNDIVKYLSKMLECNEEYVKYLMERNKLLKSINIPKIEQIIRFLFDKGYTPQEVRLFPRVFCSKIETMNKRFEEYQKVRSTLPSIPKLYISPKKFQNSIEKCEKLE